MPPPTPKRPAKTPASVQISGYLHLSVVFGHEHVSEHCTEQYRPRNAGKGEDPEERCATLNAYYGTVATSLENSQDNATDEAHDQEQYLGPWRAVIGHDSLLLLLFRGLGRHQSLGLFLGAELSHLGLLGSNPVHFCALFPEH